MDVASWVVAGSQRGPQLRARLEHVLEHHLVYTEQRLIKYGSSDFQQALL
jgi:hypothetical protein